MKGDGTAREIRSSAMKAAGRAAEDAAHREQAIHARYAPLVAAAKEIGGLDEFSQLADSFPVTLTSEGYDYQLTTLGSLRRLAAAARAVE